MGLIPLMMHYPGRLQLLDRPNRRNVNEISIPRVDGVGMATGAKLVADRA